MNQVHVRILNQGGADITKKVREVQLHRKKEEIKEARSQGLYDEVIRLTEQYNDLNVIILRLSVIDNIYAGYQKTWNNDIPF